MTITISERAARYLRRLFRRGREEGVEIHAYALGRRDADGVRIEYFVTVGTPRASAAMIVPDFAQAPTALAPYLQDGYEVVGEVHSHLDLVGPSTGDLRTLESISDQYPSYLCIVIAPGNHDDIITAHTVEAGTPLEHTVVSEEYRLLAPSIARSRNVLIVGWGSGAAAATPPILKLGFGTITVADDDVVEARNIERHLATTSDIGKPKVLAFTRFARERTTSNLRTIAEALTSASHQTYERAIEEHHVIFNATGHPVVSRTLSHLARAKGKPVLHGGAFEGASGGFVFLETAEGPCYSCLFPLHLSPEADDSATMRALTEQYGLTEDELSAQLGLWTDVNVVASIHAKILLEYLKGKTTPNLYVIDNNRVTIEHHTITQRDNCICKGDYE